MKKLAIGFVICIVFLLGALANSALSQQAGFTDMDGHTHERAAEWAADNGVMSGYPDRSFRPDIALTRGQVAEVLYRYHHGLVRKLEGDVARLHNKAIRHTHGTTVEATPTTVPPTTTISQSEADDIEFAAMVAACQQYNTFPVDSVGSGTPWSDCMIEQGAGKWINPLFGECRESGGVVSTPRNSQLRGIWCDVDADGKFTDADRKITGFG